MSEDAVILALEQQVACYRRLAKLAEAQHEHVEQGQTEALLAVLMQRQGLLDEIATLERTISPQRRRWGEFVASVGADDRVRAESLVMETRRLLEQITTADRNDTMVLQQQKMNVGRQIGATTTARNVNRKYAAAAYGGRGSRMDVQR